MDEPQTNPDPQSDDPADVAATTDDLVAFLDGELDPDNNEMVEARIGVDPTVRAEVDALKKTWDLLDYLPKPEPSPNFTERTLSRLDPIRQSGTASGPAPAKSGATSVPVHQSTTTLSVPPPRTRRQKFVVTIAWLAAFVVAGFAGYFVRAQMVHLDQQELDARILSEQRLLQNVQRYRYVDDLAFLQALDNPDLFGEEPYVTSGEAPK